MVTPTIYLALGAPARMPMEALRGMAVLESFAYVRGTLVDRYRPTWSSLMLDSGAFTEVSQGVRIDLGEYVEYALQHGSAYDVVVSLDDIRGDLDASRKNFQTMLDAGLRPMPVFHQGEPWSVLDEWIAAAPQRRIGLGFQRPIVGGREWLDEVFSRVPRDVRVHGFAMTGMLEYGHPFESVDSSTWIYEWNGLLAVKSQGADALAYLTPGELLEIVMKKYQRIRVKRAWDGGTRQQKLF